MSTAVPRRLQISGRFLKFLAVSAIAAGANVGSRIAFSVFMPYAAAVTLAFCVGLTCAFALNRKFVFAGAASSLSRQLFWFTLVNLFALAQTLGCSLLIRHALLAAGMSDGVELLAHCVGVAVPALTSYFGHRHLSFAAP